MTATQVYRILIAIRGCSISPNGSSVGGASHVSLFRSTHPYGALAADAITVAFWAAILAGVRRFFQRWAQLIFVVLLAIALLTSPFRAHHYSLSSPPVFVPTVAVLMLLLTGAILAMSFLPPVRDCFARKRPNPYEGCQGVSLDK